MKAGAVEFLTKPVSEQDLLDAINVAFERDRTRRANEFNPAHRPAMILQRLADTFCGLGGIHTPPALNSASAANDRAADPRYTLAVNLSSPSTRPTVMREPRGSRFRNREPSSRVNITRGERHG